MQLPTERTLLRLHIEAVWGVQLPPLESDEIELLPESPQPYWDLYVADLANTRITIWRLDVSAAEREALLLRANEALALPPSAAPITGVSREVALALTAPPKITVDAALSIARPLTMQDRALVEAFWGSDDYPKQELHPFVGVIIDGQLLSLAHSSRRTKHACELGIETLPQGRRKGYALAATVLWTQMILQEGLLPIYSANASNTASLRLAAAAGYRAFAQGATFEI